jgi:branched-chain amino acid transport system substrate-binding protein
VVGVTATVIYFPIMEKQLTFVTCALMIMASSALLLGCGGGSSESDADIKIGALFDLSGPGQDLGSFSKAAAEQAIGEAAGRGVSISLTVVDTGSDPARAEQGLQRLLDSGISVVIGPQTSSEARQILPTANSSGALVVSSGSTASSLAIQGDALFRLVPTDVVESSAVFELMKTRGVRSFVTVGRDDAGNQGLVNSLNEYARGGRYATQPTVTYASSQTDGFDAVAHQVVSAITAARRAGTVGVFVAGFDEVSNLLAALSNEPSAAGVGFYGGDGSAQVSSIVSDDAAATFARQSGGVPSALTTIPVENLTEADAITKAIGGDEPNAFALGVYDAVGIIEAASQIVSINPLSERQRFALAAQGYNGVSGTIFLDDAGDRVSAPYAFWGICNGLSETSEWTRIGDWVPSSASSQRGSARYYGCPVL